MQSNKKHSFGHPRVPTPTLYGYLVVHIVHTGTIGRRRTRRKMWLTLRIRRELHRIRHLQCSHERHRSSPIIGNSRCSNAHLILTMNLRALRRVHRYTAAQRGVIRRPWCVVHTLLRGARRVGTVEIQATRRWGIPRWRVLPHVYASLWRVGQLADVVHRVIGTWVGQLRLLAH